MDYYMHILYLSIIGFFVGVQLRQYVDNRTKNQDIPLRKISDVKAGEHIIATIELSEIVKGVLSLYYKNMSIQVLNNNPVDRKMFVRICTDVDGEKHKYTDRVFNYADSIFRHFSTLNPVKPAKTTKSAFDDELQVALQEQRYEEAAVIRDAIKKLKDIKPNNKQ